MFYVACAAGFVLSKLIAREADALLAMVARMNEAAELDPLSYDMGMATEMLNTASHLTNIAFAAFVAPLAILMIAAARGAL